MKPWRRKEKGAIQRPARLYGYSLGLIKRGRTRDILRAMGEDIYIGLPKKGYDKIALWGRTDTSKRGQAVAEKRNCQTVTLEDGFLRSLKTGRQGHKSHSLVYDRKGIYFDTNGSSDLHDLMEESGRIKGAEFDQAENGLHLLRKLNISKYNAFQIDDEELPDEFVLVIDQTKGDASVSMGQADESHFAEMLRAAIKENPKKKILIKTHPETAAGKREGYFTSENVSDQASLYDKPISPWTLIERADKVYCVTSQLGMEAIFAGKKPIVFGCPFYSGWGMTEDRQAAPKFKGLRGPVHLFWASYLRYCNWYDPYKDEITEFETVAWNLSAQAKGWRANQSPAICVGFRLWKRGFLSSFLRGEKTKIQFMETPKRAVSRAQKTGARLLVWAGKETKELRDLAGEADVTLTRVEDGFIRSTGLGAELVPPLSLAFDDLGIYYDPRRESRLEYLIQRSGRLSEQELTRAEKLRIALVKGKLTKYNLAGKPIRFNPKLKQRLVLIPGQVEDDASIRTGTDKVKTNKELIWAVRQRFPNAFLIYKPHPDVEAGLREGEVETEMLKGVVDHIAKDADMARLLAKVDIVATMTSLTGFEALLRGKRVVCFGTPFYAGWGLTEDHGIIPSRRTSEVSLDQLVHSTLIDYPRYWDPVTGDECTPETILHRFKEGTALPKRSAQNVSLAKLQGWFASYAHLWR